MRNELTDEQTDKMLKALVRHAGADETTISEAASSPAIWWGIQRRINAETASPWPPPPKTWRWLVFGPISAVATVLLVVFYFVPSEPMSEERSKLDERTPSLAIPTGPLAEPIPDPVSVSDKGAAPARQSSVRKTRRSEGEATRKTVVRKPVREEIRSDFIALSYGSPPESGQVVRVKVPRSMLVSMGLIASVEKPSALIDAEVVIGDDGMTRAIRFIRSN